LFFTLSPPELNKGKAKTCFVLKDAQGNAVTDLTIIAKQKKLMYENFDDRQLCEASIAVKAKDAMRRLRFVPFLSLLSAFFSQSGLAICISGAVRNWIIDCLNVFVEISKAKAAKAATAKPTAKPLSHVIKPTTSAPLTPYVDVSHFPRCKKRTAY
jgi:hypothetical protein